VGGSAGPPQPAVAPVSSSGHSAAEDTGEAANTAPMLSLETTHAKADTRQEKRIAVTLGAA